MAGFSPNEFLPEVWNVQVPLHNAKGMQEKVASDGEIGSAWFASFGPIARYIYGWDQSLLNELLEKFAELGGAPLTAGEIEMFSAIAAKYQYLRAEPRPKTATVSSA